MEKHINPVIHTETDGHTADPYVIRHNDWYYHCYCRKDGVYISKSRYLYDIGSGEEVKVYDAPIDGIGSQWYAPELHYINGAWYIYAAPQADESGIHSMAVLKYEGDSPVGTYINEGLMKGINDGWSIDGTILEHNDDLYFVWTSISEIYLAKMESPMVLSPNRIVLTKPELDFETKTDVLVNEGPAVLKHNGKIHIAYSANDSKTDDYCLGLLTYADGDIMNVENWIKAKNAVFEKTDDVFGPGHCSFTTITENGKDFDCIVYHANLESGSGWNGRSVWIQKIAWDENDMPIFGKPCR